MTVVPTTEAKYKEEYNNLLNYLEESEFSKQYLANRSLFEGFKVNFTINKEGAAEDVSFIESTGDVKMDNLLKELIKKMPTWEPAKNEKGEPITQDFELNNTMKC